MYRTMTAKFQNQQIISIKELLLYCSKCNTKAVVGSGAHQQGPKAFTVQLSGKSHQDLQLSP
ncbi:hypothetical protein ANN_06180, partial [Periplaneta americana]